MSCRSNTATSVSRMTDSAPSPATAFANSGKRWVNALPWRLTSWADLSPRVHHLVSKSPPDVLARRVEAKPAIAVKVVVVLDLGP